MKTIIAYEQMNRRTMNARVYKIINCLYMMCIVNTSSSQLGFKYKVLNRTKTFLSRSLINSCF